MPLYLDTETTGLGAADQVVEIGIVDDFGAVVLETFVNPGRPIPWQVERIHGINDAMVAGAPTLADLLPQLKTLFSVTPHVVIYNAAFDRRFFPAPLWRGVRVDCAMQAAQSKYGMRQRLGTVAQRVGHQWTGTAHRAVADALACRSVWRRLTES